MSHTSEEDRPVVAECWEEVPWSILAQRLFCYGGVVLLVLSL